MFEIFIYIKINNEKKHTHTQSNGKIGKILRIKSTVYFRVNDVCEQGDQTALTHTSNILYCS